MKRQRMSDFRPSICSCTGSLAAKEGKLQNRPKSLNPFTAFRHYRAARMFLAASKALFLDTKVE